VLRHLREVAVPSIRLLSTLAPMARQPLGGVIENQTAVELVRQGATLCGWKKTPSGGEIDFVVKRGLETCPIECKASLTFDRKNIRGIGEYLAMYRQHFGIVVSLAPQAVFALPENRTVVNVPIYLLERLPRTQASHSPSSRAVS
jgi:predicted AAA+ superfamily ATPase